MDSKITKSALRQNVQWIDPSPIKTFFVGETEFKVFKTRRQVIEADNVEVIYYIDGTIEHYKNGKLHRIGGPAVLSPSIAGWYWGLLFDTEDDLIEDFIQTDAVREVMETLWIEDGVVFEES